MDLKDLQNKQSAIEASFDTFQQQKQEMTTKLAEIDTELVKLQGEYRVVTDLIENFKNKGTKNGK